MLRVCITGGAACCIIIIFLHLASTARIATASISCTSNRTCIDLLWIGSECIDGWCTNPFESGCLRKLAPHHHGGGNHEYEKRICTSEDTAEAAGAGLCRKPNKELQYTEIRIINQDWESTMLETWLLQIILSELLDVPVTIETGKPGVSGSFYDRNNSFHYGKPYQWDALRVALENNGDCRRVNREWERQQQQQQQEEQEQEQEEEQQQQQQSSASEATSNNDAAAPLVNLGRSANRASENLRYRACGHVIPEVWNGQLDTVRRLEAEKVIEAPESLGVSGRVSWFVPKFVAERDPTLLNFLGMQGENNRRKLAEFFKRPTTWKEYCDEVSPDGCRTDDGVAKRAPTGGTDETERFYLRGLYTGHFRSTAENDCENNPRNCTGHIADFPCSFGWSSFVRPQAYHNGIAVESDASKDYSRSQLSEMWAAANATNSNLIQYWFTPDMSYQEYLGSGSEFLKVLLPTPTQACIDSRINMTERCSSEENEQVGEPEGACDNEVESIKKVVVSNLHHGNHAKEEGRRSPAYDTIKAFSITELQIGKMFDYWLERENIDKWGYDPRYATCRWAAENIDDIKAFIPPTFPRVLRDENTYTNAFFYTTFAFGSMATLLVLVAIVLTYCQRHRDSIRYAQVEVLFLILSGCLLVSVGSFLLAIEPNYIYCILIPWFITLGYTLELVPVMVKIAAMNRLTSAARRIRGVKIKRKSLFGTMCFLGFFVVVFLFLWTVVDPSVHRTSLEVTDEIVPGTGATVVTVRFFCQSNHPAWRYISFVWHCLLLISATALAFQNRNMREGFNESQLLAIMIYSKFVFLILRMITFLLEGNMSLSTVAGFRCLIFSLDTILTILVYFVPKFFAREDTEESKRRVIQNKLLESNHLVNREDEVEEDEENNSGDDIGGFRRSKRKKKRRGGRRPRHSKSTSRTDVSTLPPSYRSNSQGGGGRFLDEDVYNNRNGFQESIDFSDSCSLEVFSDDDFPSHSSSSDDGDSDEEKKRSSSREQQRHPSSILKTPTIVRKQQKMMVYEDEEEKEEDNIIPTTSDDPAERVSSKFMFANKPTETPSQRNNTQLTAELSSSSFLDCSFSSPRNHSRSSNQHYHPNHHHHHSEDDDGVSTGQNEILQPSTDYLQSSEHTSSSIRNNNKHPVVCKLDDLYFPKGALDQKRGDSADSGRLLPGMRPTTPDNDDAPPGGVNQPLPLWRNNNNDQFSSSPPMVMMDPSSSSLGYYPDNHKNTTPADDNDGLSPLTKSSMGSSSLMANLCSENNEVPARFVDAKKRVDGKLENLKKLQQQQQHDGDNSNNLLHREEEEGRLPMRSNDNDNEQQPRPREEEMVDGVMPDWLYFQ